MIFQWIFVNYFSVTSFSGLKTPLRFFLTNTTLPAVLTLTILLSDEYRVEWWPTPHPPRVS
jgi:hypothetical protein